MDELRLLPALCSGESNALCAHFAGQHQGRWRTFRIDRRTYGSLASRTFATPRSFALAAGVQVSEQAQAAAAAPDEVPDIEVAAVAAGGTVAEDAQDPLLHRLAGLVEHTASSDRARVEHRYSVEDILSLL